MDTSLLLLLLPLLAGGDKFFNNGPEYEMFLTEEDFAKAPYVFDGDADGAEYRADMFEGDIANPNLDANTVGQFMQGGASGEDGLMHNAIRNRYRLWPSRRVPYSISSRYSSYSRSRIAAAMNDYAKKTCISFEPKTSMDANYLYIMPDSGCYSMVGKTGGRQVLSLGSGCVHKGIIMHELMHAAGFFHEQSRNDRDDWITINWNNIMSGMQGQFQKYSLRSIDHLGAQYDYGSVMHYSATAFSANGLPTISPKRSGARIGQRSGFSSTDSYKLNKLYECDGPTGIVTTTKRPVTTAATTAPSGGCVNKRNDCTFLAQQRNWCNSNRNWMKEFCPIACNLCSKPKPSTARPPSTTPPAGPCKDDRDWCQRWASAGFCQGTFLTYMRTYCRKACRFC